MDWSLSLVTPPAEEPITLSEAKAYARIDFSDDDTLIAGFIVAARQQCETITRRALITQTWDLILGEFPEREIEIPLPPLQSVTSITYLDDSGVSQTLATSVYKVDTANLPGRITLKSGQSWPSTYDESAAVTIRFVAGYGNAAAVPDGIKSWLKLRTSTMYEHREESQVGTSIVTMPRDFTIGLLDPYRVQGF